MNRRTVQFRLNRLFVFYLNPMGEHESEAFDVAVFARKRLRTCPPVVKGSPGADLVEVHV